MVQPRSNLFKRVIISSFLMPLTLWLLSFGGMVATVYVGLAFLICLCELYALLLPLKPRRMVGLFVLWFLYIGAAYNGVITVIDELGASYIVALTCFVWASDIGGYVVGNLIGGPKLAPTISPSKTWSGAVGSVVFTIIGNAVFTFAEIIGPFQSTFHIILFGVFVSVLVQLGDLLESYFKRGLNVKDISHLIPGHGGFVDRLDGYFMLFFVLCVFSWFFAMKQVFCNMGLISFCN